MSKEERYIYHCDEYDYIETIYDNKECEECDSVRMATNWLNRLNNKIYDLEEKLTEKDKEINDICQNYDFQLNDFSREIYRLRQREKILEQQLTEKEKELAEYKQICTISHIEDLQIENMLLKGKDQDKISFAVEQLIKCKETLIKFLQDEGFYENEWYDLFDKIDNQIKQLKEGK